MEKPRIEKIIVKRVIDDNPDLSYLNTEDHRDKKRLADYGNTWVSLGIFAEAEVSYKENDHKRLEWFRSGGLWGIESNSDEDYLEAIETEQIQDLLHHLKRFGVNINSINLGDKNKVIYKSEY